MASAHARALGDVIADHWPSPSGSRSDIGEPPALVASLTEDNLWAHDHGVGFAPQSPMCRCLALLLCCSRTRCACLFAGCLSLCSVIASVLVIYRHFQPAVFSNILRRFYSMGCAIAQDPLLISGFACAISVFAAACVAWCVRSPNLVVLTRSPEALLQEVMGTEEYYD